MSDSASTDEDRRGNRKDWQECVSLRAEIAKLREERKLFLEMASVAALLLRDLDADTFETQEAAELLYELLQQMPAQAKEEAPYGWQADRITPGTKWG